MKIAFYCRVDGQGFCFVLPDEADRLREFFAEHQISLRLILPVFIVQKEMKLLWCMLSMLMTASRRTI